MADIRKIAFETLLLAEDKGGINTLTKDVLDKYSYLERQDRAFLKRLIETTTERRITIDHVLGQYSSVPVLKMKKQVRTLLRMGVCQILFMDVPDHAAVDETVKLIKKTPLRSLAGFVNGVLRSVLRGRDDIAWPDRDRDLIRYLSVYYSCPEWLAGKLVTEQGEDNAETLLKLSLSVRPVTARVNLSKSSIRDVTEDPRIVSSPVCPVAVILDDYDNITEIPAFRDGKICIQDVSSMLVGLISDIRPGDTVLDLCAAPGGKSLHAADIATAGSVISVDVSEKKIAAIEENIRRCGFDNIRTVIGDSSVYNEEFCGIADVVIADVPCSGIGVMGRKNDIKYNISPGSIDELVVLQRSILTNAAKYVKPGGTLIFSTCTCSVPENKDNFDMLISAGLTPVGFFDELPGTFRADSAKDGYIQLYGKDAASDGFFIGKLRK